MQSSSELTISEVAQVKLEKSSPRLEEVPVLSLLGIWMWGTFCVMYPSLSHLSMYIGCSQQPELCKHLWGVCVLPDSPSGYWALGEMGPFSSRTWQHLGAALFRAQTFQISSCEYVQLALTTWKEAKLYIWPSCCRIPLGVCDPLKLFHWISSCWVSCRALSSRCGGSGLVLW